MNRIAIPVVFLLSALLLKPAQAGNASKQDSISPVHRALASGEAWRPRHRSRKWSLPRRRKWRRCSGTPTRKYHMRRELLPLQSPCTSGTVATSAPPCPCVIPYVATAWTNVPDGQGLDGASQVADAWQGQYSGCLMNSTLWTYAALCR